MSKRQSMIFSVAPADIGGAGDRAHLDEDRADRAAAPCGGVRYWCEGYVAASAVSHVDVALSIKERGFIARVSGEWWAPAPRSTHHTMQLLRLPYSINLDTDYSKVYTLYNEVDKGAGYVRS